MSESSEVAHSVCSDDYGIDSACCRIHKHLAQPLDQALPVSSHKRATCLMLKVRDALLRGASLHKTSKMALVCSGIACMRRVVVEVDAEDQQKLIKQTQTLLFALLVMSEEPTHNHANNTDDQPNKRMRLDASDDQHVIALWQSRCLSERILETGDSQASCSWEDVLTSDAAVSKAALREAQHVNGESALKNMCLLSDIFFRCSSTTMVSALINTNKHSPKHRSDDSSFLTLDTVGLLNMANDLHDEKLHALADAAESEAGQTVRRRMPHTQCQHTATCCHTLPPSRPTLFACLCVLQPLQVLRDMILSFKLPTKALGVRKSISLSRQTNSEITKQYPGILNDAHDAAMRGALWSFESDPDPIHKMSALLAGLALIIAKDKDSIRKGNAFEGRVCLPFIDCPPAPPSLLRMALLPETNNWFVYNIDRHGNPKVRLKSSGYAGFCECVLLLSKSLSRSVSR